MRNARDIGCHLGCRHQLQTYIIHPYQPKHWQCPKKHLSSCRLENKYIHKVTNHARNTLTEYGGSPLSFGPPFPHPQGVGDPYKVEISKLYRACMLIQNLLKRKNSFLIGIILYFQYFKKIQTKNKMTVAVTWFSLITLEVVYCLLSIYRQQAKPNDRRSHGIKTAYTDIKDNVCILSDNEHQTL